METLKRFFKVNYILGLSPPLMINKNLIVSVVMRAPVLIALGIHFSCIVCIMCQHNQQYSMSLTVNWIQFLPNSFGYVLWMVNTLQKSKCFERIVIGLKNLDISIHKTIGATANNTQVRIMSVVVPIICALLSLLLAALAFRMRVDPGKLWTYFYAYAFVSAKYSLIFVSLQFASCSIIIKCRMQAVRRELEKTYKKKGLRVSKKENLNDLYIVATYTSFPSQAIDNTIEILNSIKDMNALICDYYGRQLAFNLLSAFISFTTQLYYLIVHMKSPSKLTDFILPVTLCCCILTLHFIEVGCLVLIGTRINTEWMRIKQTFNHFLLHIENDLIRSKVRDCLIQMNDNKIELKVFHCVNIDMGLLVKICSSVTSYLIILVQFNAAGTGDKNASTVSFSG